MFHFKSKIKNAVVVTIITSLLLGQGLFVSPVKAGGIPVFDGALVSLMTSFQTAILGQQTVQTSQTLFEYAMTFIKSTLKKKILDMITENIVNYIQGGGKPKFVTDWKGFLDDVANEAVGDFIAGRQGLSFLCEPFKLQLKVALLPPIPYNRPRGSCTLQDIVGNVDNFYKDFKNGGWLAYDSSLSLENDWVSSFLTIESEAIIETAKKQDASKSEAISGLGFLSTKECQKDANGKDISSTCKIITPGKAIGDLTSKALGTDIDFVVNAEEIGDFVAAVANALVNRVMMEAGKGLAGISTKKSRANGGDSSDYTFAPEGNTDSCWFFSQEQLGTDFDQSTYDSCAKYSEGTKGSFLSAQQTFVNQIEEIINTYAIAKEGINSARATSKTFANNASDRNRFKEGQCAEVANDFGTRGEFVTNFKIIVPARLALLVASSSEVVDNLKDLERRVKVLVGTDWEGLAANKTELENDSTLKLDAANSLRNRAEFENSEYAASSTLLLDLDPEKDGGTIWQINYYDDACSNDS